MTLADLVLPPHVTLVTPVDTVVVSCQAQGLSEELEEEAAAGESEEPEVIGRKAEDDEEEAD